MKEERRSRSPQARKEITKPMSAVEEVMKEPQYVVDREKVRVTLIRAHRNYGHQAHHPVPALGMFNWKGGPKAVLHLTLPFSSIVID